MSLGTHFLVHSTTAVSFGHITAFLATAHGNKWCLPMPDLVLKISQDQKNITLAPAYFYPSPEREYRWDAAFTNIKNTPQEITKNRKVWVSNEVIKHGSLATWKTNKQTNMSLFFKQLMLEFYLLLFQELSLLP